MKLFCILSLKVLHQNHSALLSTGLIPSWKVLEFGNAFFRPEKVMDFKKNGRGHGKVLEFHFLARVFYAVWKLETSLSSSKWCSSSLGERWPSSLIVHPVGTGWVRRWLMRPIRPRKVLAQWGQEAELGPVLKGRCNGPSRLLAWSWQSRCIVARMLLLLCGLHCAMLTDSVQVSPMSCKYMAQKGWVFRIF